jgi:site-specific recombinase XerD
VDEEDRSQQIQLNKRSSEILQEYLYIRPLITDSYLFINQQGEQLAMRSVRRAVKKYQDFLDDFNRRLTPTLLFKSSRENENC